MLLLHRRRVKDVSSGLWLSLRHLLLLLLFHHLVKVGLEDLLLLHQVFHHGLRVIFLSYLARSLHYLLFLKRHGGRHLLPFHLSLVR